MTTDTRDTLVIQPRKVKFDWQTGSNNQGTDMHFVKDEPFVSHFLNALSIVFPEGENWFCRTFNEALPYLDDDPKLKADAIAFVRQEAMHSRSHQTVLDYYKERGLDCQPMVHQIDWRLKFFVGKKVFGTFEPKTEKGKKRWLMYKLAIISGIEHFTCLMGHWLLAEQTALDDTEIDPQMLDLFKWHCAEEIEHRNVAFDIYNHVSGHNHWMRYMAMFHAILGLNVVLLLSMRYLWKRDPQVTGRLRFFKRMGEAVKKGLLPSAGELLKSVRRYFSKSYDTHGESNTQLALDYFEQSAAVKAGQG